MPRKMRSGGQATTYQGWLGRTVALHRQHWRHESELRDGHPAEVPQGHDLGLAPIQVGQPVENLVDRDDVQPLPLEIVHHRVERDARAARAWSMSTSRIARAADANRKLRSAARSKTPSPSSRITASWTTAVGESVWPARSRSISTRSDPASSS